MACVVDGSLTPTARRVLEAAKEPIMPQDIAKLAEMPLYQVRSSLRELKEAEFLEELEDGRYQTTRLGAARLEEDA